MAKPIIDPQSAGTSPKHGTTAGLPAHITLHYAGNTKKCATFTPEDGSPAVLVIGAKASPQRIESLAKKHGADPDALLRFVRFMEGKELFADFVDAAKVARSDDAADLLAFYRGRGVPQKVVALPFLRAVMDEPSLLPGFGAALTDYAVHEGDGDSYRAATYAECCGPLSAYFEDAQEDAEVLPDMTKAEAEKALFDAVMNKKPLLTSAESEALAARVESERYMLTPWRLVAEMATKDGAYWRELSQDQGKAEPVLSAVPGLEHFADILSEMAYLTRAMVQCARVAGRTHADAAKWLREGAQG